MCDFGTRLLSMTNLVKKESTSTNNPKSQKTRHYYFGQNEFQDDSNKYDFFEKSKIFWFVCLQNLFELFTMCNILLKT